MNISGVEQAILTNVNTEDVYVFTKISKDSKYNKRSLYEEDIDGNLIYVEDEFSMLLVVSDDVGTNLQTAILSGNKWKLELIGIGQYLNWNEESNIIMDDDFFFEPRSKNKITIRLKAKGASKDISRVASYQLQADGNRIPGLLGLNPDEEGVTARSYYPGSVGDSGSLNWMGKTIETVKLISDING